MTVRELVSATKKGNVQKKARDTLGLSNFETIVKMARARGCSGFLAGLANQLLVSTRNDPKARTSVASEW